MPGIDKKAFLAKIGGGNTAADYATGGDTEPPESEAMTCGEQLVKALGLSVDPGPVDDALREAVSKYSSPMGE